MLWRTSILFVLALTLSGGSGSLTGRYTKKGGDLFDVKSEQGGKLSLSLSGSYGMNTCQIETGPLKIENQSVVYKDPDDENCHVRVTFKAKIAVVDQQGECGCGLNVNLSGTYRKQSDASRKKQTSDGAGESNQP